MKPTEQMLAEAKAAGVEVTIRERAEVGGEIIPLPGLRRPTEQEADLRQDDDGSAIT